VDVFSNPKVERARRTSVDSTGIALNLCHHPRGRLGHPKPNSGNRGHHLRDSSAYDSMTRSRYQLPGFHCYPKNQLLHQPQQQLWILHHKRREHHKSICERLGQPDIIHSLLIQRHDLKDSWVTRRLQCGFMGQLFSWSHRSHVHLVKRQPNSRNRLPNEHLLQLEPVRPIGQDGRSEHYDGRVLALVRTQRPVQRRRLLADDVRVCKLRGNLQEIARIRRHKRTEGSLRLLVATVKHCPALPIFLFSWRKLESFRNAKPLLCEPPNLPTCLRRRPLKRG